MALSKIYKQRLQELNDDLDRSIEKRIDGIVNRDQYASFYALYHDLNQNDSLYTKIELLSKLEEL